MKLVLVLLALPFLWFPKNPNAPEDVIVVTPPPAVTWQTAATTWQGGAVTW